MQAQHTQKNTIAYKWLSYCIVFACAYYWLYTIAMIFLPKKMNSILPHQTGIYNAFVRQNWRLFATTKLYNRQLNFILRDKLTGRTDTIDLVNYSVSEKRKHAPFNNYEDGIDHILYQVMNGLEKQVIEKRALLIRQFPGMPDSFYMQRSFALVEQDHRHEINIQNLVSYGKYVLSQKGIDSAGKDFQLLQTHRFIHPRFTEHSMTGDSSMQVVFISTYKNL